MKNEGNFYSKHGTTSSDENQMVKHQKAFTIRCKKYTQRQNSFPFFPPGLIWYVQCALLENVDEITTQ